jgi:hypothetical protein
LKYNFDALSKYLMIIGALFLFDMHFRFLGIAIIGYALWRAFSKNRFRRNKELAAFENTLFVLKQKFFKLKKKADRSKNCKVFVCPNCSQKLRVPRKAGNITITCSRCRTKFKGKS